MANASGVLAEHRDPHGDVEPVQHMLGLRADPLGKRAHLLAAVGRKVISWFACRPYALKTSARRRLGLRS